MSTNPLRQASRSDLVRRTAALVSRLSARMHVGREFTPYPDDVMLVSYPRSGNTWLRFLVGNLLAPPVTFANLERVVPDIYANTARELRRVEQPRVLKSHECFDSKYQRVIYLVRDPRDVVRSYYFFKIKTRELADDYAVGSFVEDFLRGTLDPFGSWREHVGSWIGARNGGSDFLLVRYEDLVEDPTCQLRRVASFLRVPTDAGGLAQSIRLSSADRLRELERLEGRRWRPLKHTRDDIPFIHTAKPGAGSAELPAESLRSIERAWRDMLAPLGYLNGQP